jgi:salicylate hydroxylase
MNRGTKIIIAGAGIGGLTAAACLLKKGFRVEVYEQSATLGEVGAGIQTSANAVKVLYDLGLKEELEKVIVRPQAFEFRRFDTAELMHRVPLGEAHEQMHGAPYYHIHRADIHAILARAVQALDPACIRLDARATGFLETDDAVSLQFANGSSVHGDILIGADGIKSAVRAQIVGATPARYTGHVAWRATVLAERLPADFMERVVTVWCGPKNHAVVYYLCSGTVLNFVGCVEREAWEEESWTSKRPWEELKADYAGWHPKIQAIIDAMDRDSCYRWALNNRAPIFSWSTKRATLLGDAAHPTLPYMASGAVMAIEDSAVLARCIESSVDAAAALDLYQRNRAERTARIVNESTEHGELYHIVDAAEMKRAFAEKNIAKSRNEWLYCYDPLNVPLT